MNSLTNRAATPQGWLTALRPSDELMTHSRAGAASPAREPPSREEFTP